MQKDPWYHKTFEECREIRKMKIHMWTIWLLTCSRAFFSPIKTLKKDKLQVPLPQRNEMLNLLCTALGFTSKNEEYKLENNM